MLAEQDGCGYAILKRVGDLSGYSTGEEREGDDNIAEMRESRTSDSAGAAVVAVIALQLPNTASSVQIVSLHGVFVALLAGAALLFRHAARSGFRPRDGATG